MSNPFFLTRQTANLMEDFARELNAGASLFLLYGDNAVGKTRLLRELGETRLAGKRLHWIDLGADSGGDETRLDRSGEIEALFDSAENGDIIVADHFEMALKKSRHQLFLSWSTDGVDKQLNLIIASNNEGFNELRQLSQQYQARVQSFQQMPFSTDEVEAFLGFYLFPEHPVDKLSIPAPLRKQLSATQGIVGQVIEIADREADRIESAPMAQTESIRQGSRIIVSVLVLFALAVGVGWYFIGQPEDDHAAVPSAAVADAGETAAATPAADPPATAAPRPAANSEPLTPGTSADSVATLPGAQPATAQLSAPEAAPVAEAGAGAEAESTAPSETGTGLESDTPTPFATESEPGTVPDSEAVIDESIIAGQQQSTVVSTETIVSAGDSVPRTRQDRFFRELQGSLDWINNRDDTVGTVQILLLSFDGFDADNYYDYVDELARRQVDTEKLRIFKTYTGNREVYSVVYGEYESRQAAIGAIDDLPAVLRDASPIGRSVGGLWQEIRRLEVKN